jgi:signal transduction histidine kinase
MLHEFIDANRDEIIRRCRATASGRARGPTDDPDLGPGVPVFLDQLADSLRGVPSGPEIQSSAAQHGFDLHQLGFTVSQVVHGYGDICQSITGLAVEQSIPISTDEFRTLNSCLDDAIAMAVTEYGRRSRSMTDEETARTSESLGFFSHELRNLTNTALLAFDVLKTGNVGVGGSTAGILHRSLLGLSALTDRSLRETQLTQAPQNPEPILLFTFIRDIASTAALAAFAKGVRLDVRCEEDDVTVYSDRSTLSAVVHNLLQNAFKFTRADSSVTLRAGASAVRVLIEIQDECGGLPEADHAALFRPFEQRAADRSGVGLGLAYCRRGIEANHGRIAVRDMPGSGCIFTINLPRAARSARQSPDVVSLLS